MNSDQHKHVATAAENRGAAISSETAVFWALACNEKILCCNGQVAGGDTSELQKELQRHARTVTTLYLSTEPHPSIFDINSLIKNLNASAIEHCVIKNALPHNLKNGHWIQWEKENKEKITVLGAEPAAEGPYDLATILIQPTPWNTCISSASVCGNNVALVSTEKEYGVVPEIISKTMQYRAVLYSQSQKELINLLPEKNNCNELIEYICISDKQSYLNVLRYCKINRYLHTLSICDMQDLAHLTSNNLVNEIIHHLITNKSDEAVSTVSNEKNKALNGELDLQQWQVLKTDITGPCCRMTLGRRQLQKTTLQAGLN